MLVRVHAIKIRRQFELEAPKLVELTFFGVPDADNRAKHVLDGLVSAEILKDDRFPFLHATILMARPAGGKGKRTLVRVALARA